MELAMSSVTVNDKLATLTSVVAIHGDRNQRTRRNNNPVHGRTTELGRRGLLMSVALASSAAVAPEINNSKTAILQKYLKKSEENKAKNDKERLDGYYKRNYKDYFEFLQGSFEGKKELSEAEKGILEWLRANK